MSRSLLCYGFLGFELGHTASHHAIMSLITYVTYIYWEGGK